MRTSIYLLTLLFTFSVTACTPSKQQPTELTKINTDSTELSKAYFASGCFWCVEAIFESVKGVDEVISGYAGGSASNANYAAVSRGITKHAEAVEVWYHPNVIDYNTLLVVFFDSHDPTTLNRQGPDAGPQYRSTIFYQTPSEKLQAEKFIDSLTKENVFDGNITTTLESLDKFYPAEDYHQNYERRNPNEGYIRAVSVPRLNRFKLKHPELLKKESH